MNTDLTAFSVVIPTFGRQPYVAALLASLQVARAHYKGPTEVIVVDSTPSPGFQVIAEACALLDARYFPGQQSVRWKRNFGVEQARFPVILFIDSDCEVGLEIFQAHHEVYAAPPPKLGGVYGVTHFTGQRTFLWRVLELTSFIDVFTFAERYPYVQWAIGNNISYYREVFLRVGGFDDTFPFRLGGDDLDLGLRISSAGYLIKTAPKAQTTHTRDTWNSVQAIWDRAQRWGRMEYYITIKHSWLLRRDLPRQLPLFLLLGLYSTAMAIGTRQPIHLVLPPLWAMVAFGLRLGFNRAAGQRPHLLFYCLAQIPAVIYQLNTGYEFLRHGRLDWFWKHSIFSTYQMQAEWPGEVRRLWASWLALWIVLVLEAVWFGRLGN